MEKLISEIECYAAARGVKPATVLQVAAKLSGTTWSRWVAGEASCTMRTMEKIRRYMVDNPPNIDQREGAA